MRTFTDSQGREWQIAITVGSIKRVQDLLDVNLAEITSPLRDSGGPPLLTRLEIDIVLLCDVIYTLVKPQADEAGITDEQFGATLGGEAIRAAHDAFWEELADFFRSLSHTDQAKAIDKQLQLVAAVTDKAVQKIDDLQIDDVVEQAFTESAGNSPASSVSIPPT